MFVERYTPELKPFWDALIDKSANGNFLLKRSFIEYHQDRFDDFSYLIWQEKKLLAVFAAAMPRQRANDEVLIAHPGLTYGGLIYSKDLNYEILEAIYHALLTYLKRSKLKKLILKPVPRVFCQNYFEAESFIFYKKTFVLINREINSVINLIKPIRIRKGQKYNINKANKKEVIVELSEQYDIFWNILTENLRCKYQVSPAHSLAEIQQLAQHHAPNIKLYVAKRAAQIVAGVVTFSDARQGYVHTQYIGASEEGKKVGAVDAILFHVIQEARLSYQRFSFGVSSVKGEINYGLLRHKEGFGAKIEMMDTYEKYL